MELTTSNYQQFKQALDTEIQRAAEGFVKIGYLLRFARDNAEILYGSGYQNITEMASKEYGIDASQVSRFISINERFSEGGYSDKLEERYEGFGVAKLSIMLQLPDKLNEELTPDFSKSEIDILRQEVKNESEKTDLEVMIEEKAADETDEAIKEMLREADLFRSIKKLTEEGRPSAEYVKALKEILAPSGVSIKTVRVSGVGRVMIKFDESNDVKFIKVRQNETEPKTIEYVAVIVNELARKEYKDLFGEDLPEEMKEEPVEKSTLRDLSKIAPVQKKEPPKKEKKVTPAPIPKVKAEEAEVIPPKEPDPMPEPEEPKEEPSHAPKKQSIIIREDIAQSIEQLYNTLDEIRKDYMSYRLQQRLKCILVKVEELIHAETEEQNEDNKNESDI